MLMFGTTFFHFIHKIVRKFVEFNYLGGLTLYFHYQANDMFERMDVFAIQQVR